jgi:hypothetical protein
MKIQFEQNELARMRNDPHILLFAIIMGIIYN